MYLQFLSVGNFLKTIILSVQFTGFNLKSYSGCCVENILLDYKNLCSETSWKTLTAIQLRTNSGAYCKEMEEIIIILMFWRQRSWFPWRLDIYQGEKAVKNDQMRWGRVWSKEVRLESSQACWVWKSFRYLVEVIE